MKNNKQNIEWNASTNGSVKMGDVNWAKISVGLIIFIAVVILANEKK